MSAKNTKLSIKPVKSICLCCLRTVTEIKAFWICKELWQPNHSYWWGVSSVDGLTFTCVPAARTITTYERVWQRHACSFRSSSLSLFALGTNHHVWHVDDNSLLPSVNFPCCCAGIEYHVFTCWEHMNRLSWKAAFMLFISSLKLLPYGRVRNLFLDFDVP